MTVVPDPPPVQPRREPDVSTIRGNSGIIGIAGTATYTAAPGDTLARIAIQFYGTGSLYTRIVEANNILNPDLIYPGQVFTIPF
jgi:nucleoid-associated protein YgaU